MRYGVANGISLSDPSSFHINSRFIEWCTTQEDSLIDLSGAHKLRPVLCALEATQYIFF
jgi:hypothetical protein